jgi:hypothetical protein
MSPLLFLLLYVNVDASKACFQASHLPILSPQLTTAAGNYAYANLWFWEGQTLPWRPAADVIIAFFSHVDLLLFILSSCLGTLAPLGQASKFLFFSA